MEYYFGVAKERGLSREEIHAVQNTVMAVAAGRVAAQFRVARGNFKKTTEDMPDGSSG
jgi:hypothetical protein